VADAGRDTGGPRGGDEIVALSDGRFGFRMAHPTRGDRRPVFDFEEVRDAERAQERAERLRLYYVAMTRAVDRLLVSGAVDLERTADRETPIGWVLERLAAREAVEDAGEAPVEVERGEARFLLRVDRNASPSEPAEPAGLLGEEPAAEGQLALFDELPLGTTRTGVELTPFEPLPVPPVHDVRRLSYSAIALFERCSYRYFAERIAGLVPASVDRDGADHASGGLAATEIGDAVHRLLEHVPLNAPWPPDREQLAETVRVWYPTVTEPELERIASLVDAYCASALASRLAALPGARAERPFAFEHDGVLLHGRLDVLWRDGSQALVVDYKSNVLEGAEPSAMVDADYRLQRLVYALACLRDGAHEVEVVYQFLEAPDDIVSATYSAGEMGELEAQLSMAIERIRAGDFRPTPGEFVCAGCPALDLVCAGPRLLVHER
jgi:hypothetical protein